MSYSLCDTGDWYTAWSRYFSPFKVHKYCKEKNSCGMASHMEFERHILHSVFKFRRYERDFKFTPYISLNMKTTAKVWWWKQQQWLIHSQKEMPNTKLPVNTCVLTTFSWSTVKLFCPFDLKTCIGMSYDDEEVFFSREVFVQQCLFDQLKCIGEYINS